MNPRSSDCPLRAFRRDGKLIIEIDEYRFCADAFPRPEIRVVDHDALLGFACDHVFDLLHDDDDDSPSTWWNRFCQALAQGAADAGAGVRLNDGGEDRLPIHQPPELFPDEVTRTLLGRHVKEVA